MASFLAHIDFRINLSKSELSPTQNNTWLGAQWNTQELLVSLPSDKCINISQLVRSFLQTRSSSREDCEKFLGHATFAGFGSPLLNLRDKLMGPILLALGDKRPLPLPSYIWPALEWWTSITNLGIPFPFLERPPETLLWTDACETGWGAHNHLGEWIAGDWDQESAQLYMNLKELKAVALTVASPLVRKEASIRFFSDNSTTVQSIKR